MSSHNKAFSMIELIFVIVIIGILSTVAGSKLANNKSEVVKPIINEGTTWE